ncbi:hypothetical protein [Roseococcus sp. YIM B11640]|uniref:hypothetical protein n=1 Tax=Roseococcus sp. YIM B11640 TaxID=3133973 RepID=UPI003C7C15FC
MTPSRRLLAGVAAAMLAPTIASAAEACLQPAEKTAFDVRALQSQLMVVALSCQQQDQYNAFVMHFRGDLGRAYNSIQAHFRRTAGGAHQRMLDQYITNLANGQSQVGISQGSFFCRNQTPLFQQAMAATNPAALAQITTQNQIHQAMTSPECPARATPAATRNRTRSAEQSSQQPRRQASAPASTATR